MEQELKELLVERLFLDVEADDIEPDTPLSEYGVDSFLLQELIVALEEVFDVRFGMGDLNSETFGTLNTLMTAIKATSKRGQCLFLCTL